ncbi:MULTISPECIES: cytochrome bd-I oxidase subunit CydH [Vibrio]|uniref:YnhF family membrane protein n=1 Tax=Vibrio neptunius TaxID=170651 RepID=A0ABS3A1C6_9VIBR|nr:MULTISPECIES: YnhF family membrane protein [Vibrio]MBN3491751.1 YnhF family membrane protein [Vibrio neptunius]MBN3514068.1 YnhF family membrane protein [Vibrio neptunius]MBN3549114.1 YnhF family membrane protein [Vibrio neptunius]MBN3573294.1 YnhF family membrane protein [Vibrio neptunius]MBN3577576.1 YnhF family membrane protein [Vibrio neptunius]
MEHELKYALVITVAVFAVLIGFGLVAITSA